MIGETLLVGLGLLFPGAAVDARPAPADDYMAATVIDLPGTDGGEASYYQLVIERQLIIRIPARPTSLTSFTAGEPAAPRRARPAPIVWRETKAPKCIAVRSLVAMQAVQSDSIDMITRDNQRLRAKLKRGCRAQSFYSGFYMQASKDGRLCADRDALQSRSGARCEVERFRLMVPVEDES